MGICFATCFQAMRPQGHMMLDFGLVPPITIIFVCRVEGAHLHLACVDNANTNADKWYNHAGVSNAGVVQIESVCEALKWAYDMPSVYIYTV